MLPDRMWEESGDQAIAITFAVWNSRSFFCCREGGREGGGTSGTSMPAES